MNDTPPKGFEDWETPRETFELIESLYVQSYFTWDLCALKKTAKCRNYINPKQDLLKTPFTKFKKTDVCFMNPPYSRGKIGKFFEYAVNLNFSIGCTVAVLMQSNMTRASYFQFNNCGHDDIRREKNIELYFLPDIKFLYKGRASANSSKGAPMVVVFRGDR